MLANSGKKLRINDLFKERTVKIIEKTHKDALIK